MDDSFKLGLYSKINNGSTNPEGFNGSFDMTRKDDIKIRYVDT